MNDFKVGEYIIYHNGDKYELGRIKHLREDGAFVAYHSGETGAKTSYAEMNKLVNGYVIEKTTLGGAYFAEKTIDTISLKDALEPREWAMVWAAEPDRQIDVRMTYTDLKAICYYLDIVPEDKQ